MKIGNANTKKSQTKVWLFFAVELVMPTQVPRLKCRDYFCHVCPLDCYLCLLTEDDNYFLAVKIGNERSHLFGCGHYFINPAAQFTELLRDQGN